MFEKSDSELSARRRITFIEHPLESVTLALQNFHETIYTVLYKRSESV